MVRKLALALSVFALLATLPVVAAPAPATDLSAAEGQTITIGPAILAGLPRVTVTATGHDGIAARYEGVALIDLLQRAGFPMGPQLRGKTLAGYVVAAAADDYRVVFALAELDPAFRPETVLVADLKDGKPLPPGEGPYRLVIPSENRPARWIRQLRSLTLHFAH